MYTTSTLAKRRPGTYTTLSHNTHAIDPSLSIQTLSHLSHYEVNRKDDGSSSPSDQEKPLQNMT